MGASPRARAERGAGRAAADARRLAPAQGAADPPRLSAALQEHPRVLALHPRPVHDPAAPLRHLHIAAVFYYGRIVAGELSRSSASSGRGLTLTQCGGDVLRIGRGTNAGAALRQPGGRARARGHRRRRRRLHDHRQGLDHRHVRERQAGGDGAAGQRRRHRDRRPAHRSAGRRPGQTALPPRQSTASRRAAARAKKKRKPPRRSPARRWRASKRRRSTTSARID